MPQKTLQSALFAYAFLAFTAAAYANPVRMSEVRVTLFGQPCTLSGPYDAEVLKAIHSISPEEISSDEMTAAQLKAASAKLRSHITGFPNLFDRYREKLAKRLDETAAFSEGWEKAQKEGASAPLISATQKVLSGKASASFSTLARQLDRKPSSAAKATLREKLYEIYGNAIESDPQEDFHRALRRLNVNYMCAYEELDSSEE